MESIIKSASLVNQSSNLNVSFKTISDRECLYFDQQGFVNEDTIIAAQDELKDLDLSKTKKLTVVLDFLKVSDYDCQVRNLAQDILFDAKEKVESLWVITNSLEIHAAMEILSFFASKDIKVVKNQDQLAYYMLLN